MRIVLTGDSLFSSRNLVNRIDQRIVDLFWDADAVFTNAEFSTPKRDTPPGICMYLTSVRPETLDEFNDLNIRLISFANNHTVDYGPQGTLETLDAAEERGLIPCGSGRNLEDARRARMLDTDEGRVSVVACCSTWAERALASMPNADVAARPGLAPLRWSIDYVMPDEQFEQLRAINRMMGLEESMAEVSRVETWAPEGADDFKFGSAMQGNLHIVRGDAPEVRTALNQADAEALLASIRDARRRSDVVVATIHTHEGMNENWYSPIPPTFIQEFARACVDAGADVVIGQGAHFARGVEVYNDVPIFYNLGSLFMEFESGESMISPEMYNTYHLPADSRPSSLHGNRAKNPDGTWNGFYAERKCSKNFMVDMIVEEGEKVFRIVPLDLDMRRDNCLKRGLPEWATEEVGREFASDLTQMSSSWGTTFTYHPEDGTITIDN